METILLRILTEKSKLWFGQYEGLSIRQIIDLGKRAYLKWVYFNIAGISFTNSLLEEFHIYGEYLIKKPGINLDVSKKYSELMSSYGYHGVEGFVKKRKGECRLEARDISRMKFRKKFSSKGYLQTKNQGH